MKIRFILTAALGAMIMASCSDSDDPTPEVIDGTTRTLTVAANKYETWTYVNLDSAKTETHIDTTKHYIWNFAGTAVIDSVAAPDTTITIGLDWQIAFHRQTVRTNDGAVALADTAMTFDQVTAEYVATIPTDSFKTDVLYKFGVMFNFAPMIQGIGLEYAARPVLNPLLSTWTYSTGSAHAGNLMYHYPKYTYVLRTKSNRYYKLQITDFQNAEGTNGYPTVKVARLK